MAASFLIANASTGILQARLIDRYGQSRALPPAAALFAVGLVGMMVAVEADWSRPWPQVFAAVAGIGLPPIGSSIRARWSYVVADKRDLHTAFAFESVVDEVIFMVGPAWVTTLAATVHPVAGLYLRRRRDSRRHGGAGHPEAIEPPATRAQGCDEAAADALAGPGAVDRVRRDHGYLARWRRGGHRGPRGRAGVGLAVRADAGDLGSREPGVRHHCGFGASQGRDAARFRRGMIALGLSTLPLLFVDGFVTLALFLFLSGLRSPPR